MRASTGESFDVVVVGAGNAALAAAKAAHDKRAKVVVLEKAPKKDRGGNTRFSGGLFRCVYNGMRDLKPLVQKNCDVSKFIVDPYSRQDFMSDIMRMTGGRADKTLSQIYVNKSLETVRWMHKLGVNWELSELASFIDPKTGKRKPPHGGALRALHEGVGLSNDWFQIVENSGIPILYGTEARQICTTPDGRLTGIRVRGGRKGTREIACKAIVLASGGFEASPEMRTSYLGPHWSLVKVRGTRYNTGEMIRSALELGAQSYGEWSGCHATPIDFDWAEYGILRLTDKSNRLSYPFSAMLNLDGNRFADEGEDFKLYTYAKMGRAILTQRNGFAIQVFDQKSVPFLEPRYSTGTPVKGKTLEELAEGVEKRYGNLGFNKEKFLRTLEEFNRSSHEGDIDPTVKDEKATSGLEPEKTNWAFRIDEPPFVAYPAACGITFTFGGVRINENAEVIDHLSKPLPGVYSTGEMTGGFFYHNYPGGSGLMRGAVFGRIAGENAAHFAKRK